MIAAATARGIATKLNTNFSLPFDAARAERLVRAGLTTLTVSIDGAHQPTYERYRVRGDLETVEVALVIRSQRPHGVADRIENAHCQAPLRA
jgi:MoaA/NifB/PqqE/SkfB family radical SAM enzyme